jgi:hypothetical protein
MRAASASAGPGSLAADWLELRRRYELFLREAGRFEPSYEPRSLAELPGKTIIFFPELIEDFEEYRAIIAASPSASIIALPREAPRAELRRPATALAELRDTLSEAGELLESGRLEGPDLAITVAGLDAYRPYLEREAELLSLPLAIRSGGELSATPGGKLFRALRKLGSSSFSFDAMRDLLPSPAWPWKRPELGAAIMAEGLRLHAIAPWPEGGKLVDPWEESLKDSLLKEYRDLKRRVSALGSAKDFASLLKAYNAFRNDFLSPEREDWDRAADLSLARSVDALGELVDLQSELGVGVGDPFGLFMRSLDSEIYVSKEAAGVPVYEWRVAAGSFPERHFVLGASQDELSVPARSFDFLGEELRGRLGAGLFQDRRAVDRDAGPDFIAAYARSGASVSFSCPEAGFGGETAVHGFLVSISTEARGAAARDLSYREEAAWLSGRGGAPARLHGPQRSGLEAAAEALPASVGGGALLSPETARAAFASLARGGALPAIDSSSIDEYLACPYAYFFLRLLGAGPEASGISFVDALFIGDAYHEALAILFERVREEDGRFRPERLPAYRDMVGPCLDSAFELLSRSRGPFVRVALSAYRGRLAAHLERLLEAEAARFPGLEIESVERKLELEYPEVAGGVALKGRIDRLSRAEGGLVVVDYKKGKLPERRAVAPDEGGSIAEAQLPCYLRLASASGERVHSAWYLSIEGYGSKEPATWACAFGDEEGAFVPASALEGFLAAFDEALRFSVEGIAAGSFPLAPKETQATVCQGCGARGICRERYALRFGAEAATGAAR